MWRVLEDDTHRVLATFFLSLPLFAVGMWLLRRVTHPRPNARERAQNAWMAVAPDASKQKAWDVLHGAGQRPSPPPVTDG